MKEKADDSYPFIQNKDFNGTKINMDTDFFIPIDIAEKFPNIVLDRSSILISISGRIGNVGFYSSEHKAFIGGAVGICKLKYDNDGEFIIHELESEYGQKYFYSLIKASSHANITVEDIRNMELIFPEKKEEKICISTFFSSFNHLITLHQSKSFGHILKAIVSCTLSWEQRKLISCLSLLKDGTHGTHKDYPSGPLLLSAKNIKNGRVYYDETDRRISYKDFEKIHRNFKLQIGDILLTIVGSIGETALLKDSFEITFQRSVAFLRAKDNILPEFLMSEFNTGRFRNELEDRKSTSAQPGIYLGDLGEIPVFVSKNTAEQRRVGSYFESLDNLITLHQLEPFQLIFKAIAYRIIDYAKSKPPRCRKYTGFIAFINTMYKKCVYTQYNHLYSLKSYYIKDIILLIKSAYICKIII